METFKIFLQQKFPESKISTQHGINLNALLIAQNPRIGESESEEIVFAYFEELLQKNSFLQKTAPLLQLKIFDRNIYAGYAGIVSFCNWPRSGLIAFYQEFLEFKYDEYNCDHDVWFELQTQLDDVLSLFCIPIIKCFMTIV